MIHSISYTLSILLYLLGFPVSIPTGSSHYQLIKNKNCPQACDPTLQPSPLVLFSHLKPRFLKERTILPVPTSSELYRKYFVTKVTRKLFCCHKPMDNFYLTLIFHYCLFTGPQKPTLHLSFHDNTLSWFPCYLPGSSFSVSFSSFSSSIQNLVLSPLLYKPSWQIIHHSQGNRRSFPVIISYRPTPSLLPVHWVAQVGNIGCFDSFLSVIPPYPIDGQILLFLPLKCLLKLSTSFLSLCS